MGLNTTTSTLSGKKWLFAPTTRDEAIDCMRRCLTEFVITPIKTTLGLHRRIFQLEAFVRGDVDTGFLERTLNQSTQT